MLTPENMGRVADSEAFEHGQQQDLALHRRHVGERFLQPPADAFAAARRRLHVAERLAQPMEQGEHAELRILGFGDQLRLLHRHLRAQADPFVTLLLRTGNGPSVPDAGTAASW